jgi:hypothetical protein
MRQFGRLFFCDGDVAMSNAFYEEDPEYIPGQYSDVHCELRGGGAQDGLVVQMSRLFGFINHVKMGSVYDGKPLVLRWCVFEHNYEYQGSYRLCPYVGRIYQYEYIGVEGYEKWDYEQRIEEAREAAGFAIELRQFYGTHGYDRCEGSL